MNLNSKENISKKSLSDISLDDNSSKDITNPMNFIFNYTQFIANKNQNKIEKNDNSKSKERKYLFDSNFIKNLEEVNRMDKNKLNQDYFDLIGKNPFKKECIKIDLDESKKMLIAPRKDNKRMGTYNFLKKDKKKQKKKKKEKSEEKDKKAEDIKSIINLSFDSSEILLSKKSQISLKNVQDKLKTKNIPEMYEELYLSIDSSSDNETNNDNILRYNDIFSEILGTKGYNDDEMDKIYNNFINEINEFNINTFDNNIYYKDPKTQSFYFDKICSKIKIFQIFNENGEIYSNIYFTENKDNKTYKLFPGCYDNKKFFEICKYCFDCNIEFEIEYLIDFIYTCKDESEYCKSKKNEVYTPYLVLINLKTHLDLYDDK